MLELVNVVNFDDSGAFIEPPAEPQTSSDRHAQGIRHHDSQQHSLDSSLGSSNGSSGSAASSSSSASVPRPDASPSFESFLATPRDFMAAHALHSATEATLLLDIAGLAIEMDTIVECVLEQIHDRQQLTRQLTATLDQEAQGAASLATTLIVVLREAGMSNLKTLTTLLQRLQTCVDRLGILRYPLAQCIETNMNSAHELHAYDLAIAQSRRLLAQAEEGLLKRLESLVDPRAEFKMTPFIVPRSKPRSATGAAAQVYWPASSSFMASGNSPYRALDDVRLSSSTSSSSSIVSLSSSTTQTTSLPPTTPIRERNESLHDTPNHSQPSSKSPSGSSLQQHNGSSSNGSSSGSR